jgi:hypothetical protein
MRRRGGRPLTLVEGAPTAIRPLLDAALEAARLDGWAIVRGWGAPMTGERVVCTGTIATTDDARRALLAAMAGAGLVAGLTADRVIVGRLADELRAIGAVDHVVMEQAPI